jgi:polar amino acid transport system substrate-binding protein
VKVVLSLTPEARLGVMAGAVEYNYAYEAGIPPERVDLYPDYDLAMEALEEGEVDAIGMTALTVRALAEDTPFAEATPQFYPTLDGEPVVGYGGFAFRQEDQELLQAFNEQLEGFIGSEEHWALVAPFGFTPEMEPDRTAEELCRG